MRWSNWIAGVTLFAAGAGALAAPPASLTVFFGTYTGPNSKGVYRGRFQPKTGRLEAVELAAEVKNPSWVTFRQDGRVLYAVTEVGNSGQPEAAITAFAIDAYSGSLSQINTVGSGGGGACHLAVNRNGTMLYVAHYGSGSVAAFRLQPDGAIGERTALVQHTGSGVNPKRQLGPHAHAVVLSPDERFLIVPDLGLDEYRVYRVDAQAGTLVANSPSGVKVKPGSGPRHFVFDPAGRFAYGLNEMGSSVTAFVWDAERGALAELATVSNLAPDFTGEDNSAEIAISQDGRFVYASNRGADTIAVHAVKSDGRLEQRQIVPMQGRTPRGFALDPTGGYLLAGNQQSDTVMVFRIDKKSGRLSPVGEPMVAPAPVCVMFVPLRVQSR